MFCPNCGSELEQESRFCGLCGYDLKNDILPEANAFPKTEENSILRKKREKQPVIVWLVALFIAVVMGSIVVVVRSNTPEKRLQKQLDLGYKYMAELDYENAIASFNAAMDIDPKNVEAYAELIDVYVAVGDKKQADKVLEQAKEFLQEDMIAELQNKVKTGFEILPEKTSVNADEEIVAKQESTSEETKKETKEATKKDLSRTERIDSGNGSYLIREYDVSGYKIKEISYNADGTNNCWNTYEYDENGNEIKATYYNTDGTVARWNTSEYNTNRKLMKWTHYNADGTVNCWGTYEYNETGNNSKQINYNGDGTVSSWFMYEYDEAGNNIKATYYNGDGTVTGWTTFEYDMNRKLIKWIGYNADGSIKEWVTYEYDANGNEIKFTRYNADGSVQD